MTRLIVVCLLLFASAWASARTAPVTKYYVTQADGTTKVYYEYTSGGLTAAGTNEMAVRNAVTAEAKAGEQKYTFDGLNTSATNSFWYIKECLKSGPVAGYCSVGSKPRYQTTASYTTICPDNSAPNQGYSFAQQCPDVPPPPPTCPVPAGTTFNFGAWVCNGPLGKTGECSDARAPLPTSSETCKLQGGVTGVEGCYGIPNADGKTQHMYCIYTGVSNGQAAEQSGNPAPNGPPGASNGPPTVPEVPRVDMPPVAAPPNSGCPKGSVMAGYNSSGTPMCVGTGTAPPGPTPAAPPVNVSKSTTANPDGSSTTTTTTVTTNADGSKTTVTDKVTTAAAPAGGGAGATTTEQTKVVSATPSGAPGTETKPDQVNFCKQNPTLSICRESSVSGTCGQTACMGDAIQCATLRAAAAMECKQRTDEDALKALSQHALGQAAANGADPDAGTLPSVKNASVVDMGTMQASGWIGGGSAFKDVSFTVQGKTFAVPLNKWTGYLVGLRYALMVVAMLVSFRMLSGAILKD